MKHRDRFSKQQPGAQVRKLVRRLHTMGSSIDPDLLHAIDFVRSGRASLPLDASIKELLEALHDEELSIRADAAHRLGTMGEHVPIEPLLEALHDEQRFVRAEVARALGNLGRRVSPDPLIAALQDRDGSVRVAAAEALGMLGQREALDGLTHALSDPWPPVREEAMLALGKLEEQVPLSTLRAFLRDEDKFVRVATQSVLRGQGKRLPIAALLAAVGNVQKQVRVFIVKTIRAFGAHVRLEAFWLALQKKMWSFVHAVDIRVSRLLDEGEPIGLPESVSEDFGPPVCVVGEAALLREAPLVRFPAFTEGLYVPEWVRENTVALVIVSTILFILFLFTQRKRVFSVLGQKGE